MDTEGWYNGYGLNERNAKLRELKRRIRSGEQETASGPCDLCGDPDMPVEYHDEDYSKDPYLWGPPALFKLCRHCHRSKLHKRFADPIAWQAFLVHVRRGGYARDLKDPAIALEFKAIKTALNQKQTPVVKKLREYARSVGSEWFATLSTNPETLASPSSRPRP